MNAREQFAFNLCTVIAKHAHRSFADKIGSTLHGWFKEMPDRADRAGLRNGATVVGERLHRGEPFAITVEELSAAFLVYFEDDNDSISPWCPWLLGALGVHEVPAVSDEPAAELRKVA